MRWLIESLTKLHDRTAFDCGQAALNDFITRHATNYTKRQHARVFVAVRPGEPRVCGYFSLSADSVPIANWPEPVAKRWPKHRIPVVLLGRLAVDRLAQGQKLGRLLLGDAVTRSAQISALVGACAVRVEAIDATAAAFYQHFGFTPFDGQPHNLFLPIATVTAGP